MSLSIPEIYRSKEAYSAKRLAILAQEIDQIEAAKRIPQLTIFVAGSYARQEASVHSDLDIFFICEGDRSGESESRTNELEMFGEIIRATKRMEFPKFSADCQYLEVHTAADAINNLGSRDDDAKNYFTMRLLLLLESHALFGTDSYETVLDTFIESYFRDYSDHPHTFEPTFLVNDIARYWRTLLANYEHDRNQAADEQAKLEQKVKNYKLKYSRLTTCFATIAALASYDVPIGPDQVKEIVVLTPRKRLELVAERRPSCIDQVQVIIDGYASFLEMTELTKDDLEDRFRDRDIRSRLTESASAHGDAFFELMKELDRPAENGGRKLLRTLVV